MRQPTIFSGPYVMTDDGDSPPVLLLGKGPSAEIGTTWLGPLHCTIETRDSGRCAAHMDERRTLVLQLACLQLSEWGHTRCAHVSP